MMRGQAASMDLDVDIGYMGDDVSDAVSLFLNLFYAYDPKLSYTGIFVVKP